MNSRSPRILSLLIFVAVLVGSLPGCGLFTSRKAKPEKIGPKTVEEWMDQPRVKI